MCQMRLNKTINIDDCKFSTFFKSDGVINFLQLLSRLTMKNIKQLWKIVVESLRVHFTFINAIIAGKHEKSI